MVRPLRFLSLCSGIGGIDLAAEWAGMEIAGQVELDPYCVAVLTKHWPTVKRMGDIREVVGDEFGPVDIIAGGIPCQPWSVAGKQRGARDDRHLWPQMRRIVEVAQPTWVIVENVAGFARLALDDVCADLDARGYEVGACVLPAASVGAPHLRERVFVVAHANGQRRQQITRGASAHEGASASQAQGRRGRLRDHVFAGDGEVIDLGDTAGTRPQGAQRAKSSVRRDTARHGGEGMAYAVSSSRSGRSAIRQRHDDDGLGTGWPQEADDTRQRHAGTRQSRVAEPRVGRVSHGISRGVDGDRGGCPRHPWPAGPSEAQHAWEAPRTVTGSIPNRASRLKALGNAVVPQQCYPILTAIVKAEA